MMALGNRGWVLRNRGIDVAFFHACGEEGAKALVACMGGGEKSGELNCSRTVDPNQRKPKLYSIKIKSKLDSLKF
jgi:hypothetical protein